MPGAKPKSSGAKAMLGLGPGIPLAIALLHGAVTTSTNEISTTSPIEPVVCAENIDDYQACHGEYPTGCNSTGKYDAQLNYFKNLTNWANPQVQKWYVNLESLQTLEDQLPSGLGKSNHAVYVSQLRTLGEGEITGVFGYLYGVKAEGQESSNCQLEPGEDNENVDFHIYIGFDAGVAGRLQNKTTTRADKSQMNPKSVIVEMTPHYRAQFHPEWTLAAVQAQIGHQVKVTGQLMVDNEHYIPSQDCNLKGHTATCWRGTVWELHPITAFEVCAKEPCEQDSGEWVLLGQGDVSEQNNSPSMQSKGIAKGESP